MEIYKVRDDITDNGSVVKQSFTFSSIKKAYEYLQKQIEYYTYNKRYRGKYKSSEVVRTKGGFYVSSPDIGLDICCDIICETVDECKYRVLSDEEVLEGLGQSDKKRKIAAWPGMENNEDNKN